LSSIKRYLMIGIGVTGVLHEKRCPETTRTSREKRRNPITSLATLHFPHADTAAEKNEADRERNHDKKAEVQ